jgi:tetratricopeptide (TPR) repeat protein
MGLTRLNRLEDVVALYERQGDAVRGLLSRPGEGGAMVVPHIFRALREAGRWGEALAAVGDSLHALGPRFAYDLLSDASDMLRRGRIAEAGQVLDFLHRRQEEIIETLRTVAEDVAQHFAERLDRKMAQCLQSQGELPRARDILDRMLDGSRPRELASILADRGLVEGGFKALSDVRLPATEEEEEQVAGALAQGEGFFRRAIDEDPEYATNAAYCLGILAMLRRDERRAIARLTAALTGMSRQAELYRVANVLGRTEFLLGLSLLESADPAQARYAGELVLRALRAGTDVPLRWWARTTVAASMYGDALASQIGEELCAVFGDAVIDSIGDIPQVLHATAVRAALSRRAADEVEPIARRWRHYERLLRHALATGDREAAVAALDALEGLAQQDPEREQFLELLADPQRYEPAWTREDALWARVRGLEALGRYEEAAGLLAGVFHARLVDAEPEDIEEARGIVGRIRAYGLRGYDLSPLERRLQGVLQGDAGERQAERDAEALETGPPILVVLVGGNETQARYDEALQREIQAQHPRVRVEFIHTNWSSNWGRQLDDMRGRLVAADAVVVMRMIRTELGRRIRAMSPVWVPCIGHGKESIRQAIVRAATVAAVRRRT